MTSRFLTGPFTRLLTTQPVIIQTALPSFMAIHAFPISGSICSHHEHKIADTHLSAYNILTLCCPKK